MAGETASGGRPRRVFGRWVWPTLIVAFIAWHTAFDVTIDRGMHTYLDARARYERHEGPEVTIRGSMEEARRLGAWRGLAGAGVVVALSFVFKRLRE